MNENTSSATTVWSASFLLLSLSNALLFAGFHLLLPTLPLFAAAYGATSPQIGLIVGGFTFSAIAIRFLAPAGIRRWGRNRFFAIGPGNLHSFHVQLLLYRPRRHHFSGALEPRRRFWNRQHLVRHVGRGTDSAQSPRRRHGLFRSGRHADDGDCARWPVCGFYQTFQAIGLFSAGAVLQISALLILALLPGTAASAVAADSRPAVQLVWRKFRVPCFLALLLGICMGGVMSFITLLAQERHFANPGLFFPHQHRRRFPRPHFLRQNL